MPETFQEKINLILRDYEGYTGDGQGNFGALPIGDISTARKPIIKRDLRELLEAFQAQEGAISPEGVAASLVTTNARGLTSTGVTGGGFVVQTGTPTNGLTLTNTPTYRVVTQLGIGTVPAQTGIALSVGQGIKVLIDQAAITGGLVPIVKTITAADRLEESQGTARILIECQTNSFAGLWASEIQNAIMRAYYYKALEGQNWYIFDNQDNPVVTAFANNGNGRDISWGTLKARTTLGEVTIAAFPLTYIVGDRILYVKLEDSSPYPVYNSLLSADLIKQAATGEIVALYVSDTGRYSGLLVPHINRRMEYDQLVGSRDHPSDRIDAALTPFGHVKTFARGREHMTYLHSGFAGLDAGIDTRTHIAAVGDSYTFRRQRWSGKVADKLFAQFGDGGGGWTGFGFTSAAGTFATGGAQPADGSGNPSFNGNIRPDDYGVVYDGAWTPYYFGANALSPDGDSVTSTTAGNKITVNCPASPDHTAFRLFWVETASGVMRYRVNGGAWTVQSTSGTVGDSGSADIAVTAGAQTIEIEVVSGTVTLCGGDWRSDAAGVVFHKMGSSGSNIGNWQSPDQAKQEAMWAQMSVDGVVLFDGTNSQSAGFGPESLWKLRMGQVIDRMQAAWNKPSTLIVVPAENGRTTNTYPMSDYAYQGLLLSHELDAAFVDLQGNFGPVVADYLDDGARPLLNSDLIHPTDDGGGALIASAIWQMIAPY